MKVAEVNYVGRSRRHSRTAPSGRRYRFTRTTSGNEDYGEAVEDVQDARYFERHSVFEVEWTPLGLLAKQTEGPVTEVEATLSSIGYRQKQRIAKALDVKAGGSEEELEERLKPAIKELQQQMEAP